MLNSRLRTAAGTYKRAVLDHRHDRRDGRLPDLRGGSPNLVTAVEAASDSVDGIRRAPDVVERSMRDASSGLPFNPPSGSSNRKPPVSDEPMGWKSTRLVRRVAMAAVEFRRHCASIGLPRLRAATQTPPREFGSSVRARQEERDLRSPEGIRDRRTILPLRWTSSRAASGRSLSRSRSA